MSIDLVHENRASVITFNKAPMNLLDTKTMDALIEAHQEADRHPDTRVIVTRSGIDGIFCNGLDPMFVLKTPVEERRTIFNAVGRMLHELLFLKKPHIAELNGPAMAGGAILAITADFRFMHAEIGKFCFAEAKVGLPVPKSVLGAIQLFCHPGALREVAMLGKNMDAAFAHRCGLADGLADSREDLAELVRVQTARLARLSPAVLAATKRAMRDHLFEITKSFADRPGEFMQFCGPEYLGEGLTALVENRPPVFNE